MPSDETKRQYPLNLVGLSSGWRGEGPRALERIKNQSTYQYDRRGLGSRALEPPDSIADATRSFAPRGLATPASRRAFFGFRMQKVHPIWD